MNILLIGAGGNAGSRILKEALGRGHKVTALARTPEKISEKHPALTVVPGTVQQPGDAGKGVHSEKFDVVISAVSPPFHTPEELSDITSRTIDLTKAVKAKRFLMVGGAGSLFVAPGVQLVDTDSFPQEWKHIAYAHRDALKVLESSDVSWTYFSPAALFVPGEKTGKFRLAENQLVSNEKRESSISFEDYAVAMINEAETPQFERKQFSIGY